MQRNFTTHEQTREDVAYHVRKIALNQAQN